MGTDVNEPITVSAIFERGQVRPDWFLWGRRRYPIREITQRWQTRDGNVPLLHLGVSDGATCFELVFNQHTLLWRLASVETDGIQ